MRLIVGALACFATLSLFAACHAVAAPATSGDPTQNGSANGLSQVNWLSLNQTETTPIVNRTAPQALDPRKDGPVLLPLPREGWACITLLVAMAGIRGLKRARVI